MAEPAGTRRERVEEWSHPEFALIARDLHQTAGLVFPPNRRESAEAGMRRAMAAGCLSDPRDLRRAVAAAGDIRDALITELTVGETYFMREPGQFEFLRTTVLPKLRGSTAQRRLRVWSAGCATGEEPYSLAILLREAAWPGGASILGTDLATARLAAARRARYTSWSMRGVSEHVIARHFERRGKQFILRADIRRSVDFQALNLAADGYPSPASGIERMDVIFCRNVLIYFDLHTVTAIATRLLASLAPDGWLFLGASDPPIGELVPCEVVMTGAGLAYRRRASTIGEWVPVFADTAAWVPNLVEPAAYAPEPQPVSEEHSWFAAESVAMPVDIVRGSEESPVPRDSYETAYDQADYVAASTLAREAIARGDDSDGPWIVLVRSLANGGDLDAAGEACAAALDRHRLSAELTHLHAVLLAEAGRYADAAVAARQALYLDPRYVVAHLALGDSLSRSGDMVGARRAFSNAQSLLKSLPPDAMVPGADGADASRLLGIARFRLGSMRPSGEVRR